jgi:hypothetical protein
MSSFPERALGTPLPASDAPAAAGDAGDRALLRTVRYAALFQSALTLFELHRQLMDVRLGRDEIHDRLDGEFLRRRVIRAGERVHLRGCEHWIALGEERQRRTEALLAAHRWLLRLVMRFPFVRLVALSGACAHDNATDSDVDLFVIVRRGRAWAVALTLMAIAKVVGKRRSLCLNYIVDEDALALPEQDLFTAAEIVGLRPLAGGEAYRRFVEANAWVAPRFPNFFDSHGRLARVPRAGAPRWLERILDAGPAPVIERLSRWLLGRHFRRQWGPAREGIRLSRSRLKLHAVDHGPRLRSAFEEAVRSLDGDD